MIEHSFDQLPLLPTNGPLHDDALAAVPGSAGAAQSSGHPTSHCALRHHHWPQYSLPCVGSDSHVSMRDPAVYLLGRK